MELCCIFAFFDKGIIKRILRKIILFFSGILALSHILTQASPIQTINLSLSSWLTNFRPPFECDAIYIIAGVYLIAHLIVIISLYSTSSMTSEQKMNDTFSFYHSISDLLLISCAFLYG